MIPASDARLRDLARTNKQKQQLKERLEEARSALVQQVKVWGFFNPFWQQSMDELPELPDWDEFEDSSVEVEDDINPIPQAVFLHTDNWIKVMEADLLRYESEPIEVIEQIRSRLLNLPEQIREVAKLRAHLRFHEKHPGYLAEDSRFRLTTISLKACWMEEAWYVMATANRSSHINKFRLGMQAWIFRPLGSPQHFVVFGNSEDEAKETARQFVVDETDSSSFEDWVKVHTECLGKTFTQGKAVEIVADTTWVRLIEGLSEQGVYSWHENFKTKLAEFRMETFYLVKKDESERILSDLELMLTQKKVEKSE